MALTNEEPGPNLPAMVETERVYLRIPSRLEWIEKTIIYLEQKAILCGICDSQRSGKLVMALHEALTNSVIHGNLEVSASLKREEGDQFAKTLATRAANPEFASRYVEITIDYDGKRCEWVLTDLGRGFDFEKVMAPEFEDDEEEEVDPDSLLPSGRGILMMRAFMDDVQYRLGGRQVMLTMLKSSGHEKRERERLSFFERVRTVPVLEDGSIDWQAAENAVSRNLSKYGIQVVQSRISKTDRIIIEVGTGEERTYLPATISNIESVGDGTFRIGCQFQEMSEIPQEVIDEETLREQMAQLEESIHELLGRVASDTGPTIEQREFGRVNYTERIDVILPQGGERRTAYARDLSKGGLSFVATFWLPDQLVKVVLYHGEKEALHIRARVTRCESIMEGFYDIGLSFLGWIK